MDWEREPREADEPIHDLADDALGGLRDAPPDVLAPIDPDAPVSGHAPAPEPARSIAESPEHDWTTAAELLYPTLRPLGTQGLRVDDLDPATLAAEGLKSHAQPLVADGPAGLPVVFALRAGGFDVLVNGDHLLSWGVGPEEVATAAFRNLAGWSAQAGWSDEVEDSGRRLISSSTGDGWDASRILLSEVRAHLARELGDGGRVLVGLPERDLLVAGRLRPDDADFGPLFADFVVEQSGEADEPIDRRVFELVDDALVEFLV